MSLLSGKSGLATSTIILAVSRALGSIVNIGLFAFLSHQLDERNYGDFRQLWLLNKALVLEVFSLGIPFSLFYFLPRLDNPRKKVFIAQTLIALSASGVLVGVFLFALAPQISVLFNNPNLIPLLRVFSLFSLFSLPTLALEGVYITLGQTYKFGLFSIFEKVLMLVLVVITTFMFSSVSSLVYMLVGFAFVRLLVAAQMLRVSMRSLGAAEYIFGFREQLKFSLPNGLSNIVNILNVELDKVVITSFYSVERFAKYANGAVEVPLLGTVVSSLNSVLMPEYSRLFAEGDCKGAIELWHASVRKVSVMFIPLVVLFYICAEDFIVLLFSEKYVESVPIFRIYLLSILATLSWASPLLVAMGRSQEPLWGSLIALVCNLGLNYAFIRLIGFNGPAIATVVTSYLVLAYYLLRMCRVTGISLFGIFPWRRLAVIAGVSLAIGYLAQILYNYFPDGNFVRITLCTLFFIPVVAMALRFAGAIEDEDLEFGKRLLRGKLR